MNKKIITGIIIVIVIIIIIATIFFIKSDNDDIKNVNDNNNDAPVASNPETEYKGYTYKVGYISGSEDTDLDTVLTDYEMLEEFINKYFYNKELFTDYNEEYFKEKNLAVKYVITTSGGDVITYTGYRIDGDKIIVDYNLDTSQGFTDDMSGYFIIVECSKSIIDVME